MKLLAGLVVSAGLVLGPILLASAANAQAPAPLADRSPYSGVSDFDGPYGAPLPARPPYAAPYDSEGPYGYAPELLPPREIYAVLRDNGFVPLGPPHRRGYTYEIRGVPRPPAPIPHVARRAVPLPAPKPTMAAIPAKAAERTPHVAVEKSVEATAKPQTAAVTPPPASAGPATIGETKPPEPQIRPTEPMPPVQGFE